MNGRRMLLSIAIALAGTIAGVAAQSTSQVRDPRAPAAAAPAAPKGSSEVTVVVTTDQEPRQPLRRAAVTIRAGELDVPYAGLTDDEGRIVFRDLAAGNYLLTAERAGYVKTYYGSAQPGRGPGVAITVLEGQRLSNITLRLPRGGVIAGTLRNVSGRPAQNQGVRAIMVRTSGGERRAVSEEDALGRFVSTDDRGVFRFFGLPPGDYLVSVPLSGSTDPMRQVTPEELQWADKMVGSGSATYPPQGTPPPAPAPVQPVAYSPVYYPGTAVASEASVITLGLNEERSGLDFALRLVPTAKITGLLVDAQGRPQASQRISVTPLKPEGLDLFSSLLDASGFTQQDGTFTIQNVRPGAYTLSVRATPKSGDPNAPTTPDAPITLGGIFGGGPATSHYASETVDVNGVDVNGINLVLRPGMTITGKVVYEATTKTPPADLSKTSLTLMAAPSGSSMSDLTDMLVGGTTLPAKIAADGSFTVAGIPPGRYRLNTPFGMIPIQSMASAFSGGWTLKSVMAGGRDIADAPLEMKAGTEVTDVVVTFTDHPAELSGSVVDGAGRVTPGFPIVVFSTDRAYWTLASRRVQVARPSSDGKFKVTGLPAGEYYVCAVTAVDRTEAYDPGFLEQLVAVASKITIADGEKKVQDLKLGGK